MAMKIHGNQYCLHMRLCRSPTCRSTHACHRDGQDVIPCCSISLQIPLIHFWICCFKSLILAEHILCTLLFDTATKELAWQSKMRSVGRPGVPETRDGIWHLKTSLPTNWCFHTDCYHAQWSIYSHSTHFHESSQHSVSRHTHFFFTDITWPACSLDLAIPQYFLWGHIKSQVYKMILANTDDLKKLIQECIQRIPKKCYMLHPFHRDCRSVLNNMVGNYNVSYSNHNN